jgi:hypothetical protein
MDFNKPDAGIIVLSGNMEETNQVKVEKFPMSKNILTPEEAFNQGLSTILPNSKKRIAVWAGGISKRFEEYCVQTTPKEITDATIKAEEKDNVLQKQIWVQLLRNLHKYTDAELNDNWNKANQNWRDWCNDVVLYFAYNSIIFGKGIPAMELTKTDIARAK